ncbi:MAG: hypothetical protein ACT4QD_03355 [Acidobacteriota bacterium]
MRSLVLSCAACLMAVPSVLAQSSPGGAAGFSDLFGPRSVVPPLIACTDMPTVAEPVVALRVIAPHTGTYHAMSRRGDLVVINAGTPQGLMIGQQYFARRVQRPLHFQPISKATPGAIRTSGWLTVVSADERFALARIDYACTSVENGDYLEPYVEPTLPAAAPASAQTDFTNLGRVLQGSDRREIFGAGDVLNIDRGAAAGVTAGARVAFYRDRRNGTPLVELGQGVVIEVTNSSSKVVVDRSAHDVHVGDYFGMRQTP